MPLNSLKVAVYHCKFERYGKKKSEKVNQAEYMLAFSVIDTGIGIPSRKTRGNL